MQNFVGKQKIITLWGTQISRVFWSLGSLSHNDGEGCENVTKKRCRTASNLIALVPSRSIRQMLKIFSVSKFRRTKKKVVRHFQVVLMQ